MKKREEVQYDRLDPRYEPISAWGYLGYQILFAIPVIGWLFLIIFACNGSNLNRRAFARSYFCVLLIGLIFFGILALLFYLGNGVQFAQGILQQIMESLQA